MPPRPSALPASVSPYRSIGPFDADSLPKGLRATHRLKAGSWARVALEKGALTFVWDDEPGGRDQLSAPAEIIVPPEIPHHVEGAGPFRLTITFFREKIG